MLCLWMAECEPDALSLHDVTRIGHLPQAKRSSVSQVLMTLLGGGAEPLAPQGQRSDGRTVEVKE